MAKKYTDDFFMIDPEDRMVQVVMEELKNLKYMTDDESLLKKIQIIDSLLFPIIDDPKEATEEEKQVIADYKAFKEKINTMENPNAFSIARNQLRHLMRIMKIGGYIGGDRKSGILRYINKDDVEV